MSGLMTDGWSGGWAGGWAGAQVGAWLMDRERSGLTDGWMDGTQLSRRQCTGPCRVHSDVVEPSRGPQSRNLRGLPGVDVVAAQEAGSRATQLRMRSQQASGRKRGEDPLHVLCAQSEFVLEEGASPACCYSTAEG
eukprot:366414-Chlamydomonas_euryale.AAC.10